MQGWRHFKPAGTTHIRERFSADAKSANVPIISSVKRSERTAPSDSLLPNGAPSVETKTETPRKTLPVNADTVTDTATGGYHLAQLPPQPHCRHGIRRMVRNAEIAQHA